MRRRLRNLLWPGPLGLGLTMALLAACGGGPTATPVPSPTPETGELTPVLATTVLRVGTQRVAFMLATAEAWLGVPEVAVATRFLGGDTPSGEYAVATGHRWPDGFRTTYATELTFDAPGTWRLDLTAGDQSAQLDVDVADRTGVQEVARRAPASLNRTLRDVASIEDLTSDWTPDPDLYRLTIAEALGRARPTVIVFATPSFCTSPTCGPQVDTVSLLKERFAGQADFIHVETYDRPNELLVDLRQAPLAPSVHEWGLDSAPGWVNESWVFLVDAAGCVASRFEAFTALGELELALDDLIDSAVGCEAQTE